MNRPNVAADDLLIHVSQTPVRFAVRPSHFHRPERLGRTADHFTQPAGGLPAEAPVSKAGREA